jgi:hypothetical protein
MVALSIERSLSMGATSRSSRGYSAVQLIVGACAAAGVMLLALPASAHVPESQLTAAQGLTAGSTVPVLHGTLTALLEQHTRGGGGGGGGGAAVPRGGGSSGGGSRGGGQSSGGSTSGGNSGPTTQSGSSGGSQGGGTATGRSRDGRSADGQAVERRDGGGGRPVVVPGGYGRGYYGGFYPWGWGGLGFGGFYGVYDPWWYDPYPPEGVYAGPAYGYEGALKLRVRPRQAEVYVDGYFAGAVDDYDGAFQSLKLDSGPHRIEIRLDGYEPLSFDIRVLPNRTITYKGELHKRE